MEERGFFVCLFSMRRHVGFTSNFAYQYIHKTCAYTPINYSHMYTIGCSIYI